MGGVFITHTRKSKLLHEILGEILRDAFENC
jgi:hypothetical protein